MTWEAVQYSVRLSITKYTSQNLPYFASPHIFASSQKLDLMIWGVFSNFNDSMIRNLGVCSSKHLGSLQITPCNFDMQKTFIPLTWIILPKVLNSAGIPPIRHIHCIYIVPVNFMGDIILANVNLYLKFLFKYFYKLHALDLVFCASRTFFAFLIGT